MPERRFRSINSPGTKGVLIQNGYVSTAVCAKCSPARYAIYSRDTAIRICSVPQLTCKNRFLKISLWDKVMSLAK